jgi:dipeptidase E
MDAATPEVRLNSVRREVDALIDLGFSAEDLDLRKYFSDPDRFAVDIRRYDVMWLRGGNPFVLRRALEKSRANVSVLELLKEDAIAFAG